MLSVTLAGMREHAVRFILTGLVVVLSVGFTAGTLVLADSLDRVGVREVTATAQGVDLAVSPGSASQESGSGSTAGLDLDAIAAIDGVDSIIPRATTSVRGSDADGRIDEGVFLRAMAVPADDGASGVTLADGRLPRRDDEAVVDTTTAERAGVEVGDTYTIAPWDQDPVRFSVVGLAEPSVAGGGTVGTTLDSILATGSDISRVDVVLADGAVAGSVTTTLEEVTGGSVESGAALRDRLVDESGSLATALRVPLLILGAVAVIVAAFVIANTFRILVAQRTRDLALLRTVGATRRQVRRGVLIESLLVGVAGSVLGLLLGASGAALAGRLIASGADLPVVISASTVGWSLAIGIVVTVGAAWVPARAATRVAPLAALRAAPDGTDDARTGRVRRAIGILLVLGGTAVLVLAAVSGTRLGSLGLGVVVLGATVFGLGVLVLGPILMPPLVAAGGRAFGMVTGRTRRATVDLATTNALRHPRRVATTSGALLIGVTVVVGFSVMATSARAAADQWADDSIPADITVSLSGSAADATISDDAIAAVASTPDVAEAVPVSSAYAESYGMSSESSSGNYDINGVDMEQFAALTDSDLELPGEGEALLDEYIASTEDIEPGDSVAFVDAQGEVREVTIVAVTDRAGSGVTVPHEAFTDMFPDAGVTTISVDAVAGADVETVRTGIVERTAGHTELAVQNAADVRDDAMAQFDRAIGVALAVLGLAVVIAVIGIGNTMSLAVHERTREIGLLRALGLTRRQTRSMLGVEAVMISAVAGALGVLIAVALSWAAVRTLPDMTLAIPWAALVGAVVVAGALGWAAALIPARRAARTSPVVALATE